MARLSAGILMFRRLRGEVEVLLAHPGGPFWAKKDLAAWSLPKGEYPEGADAFAAALREFEEETGVRPAGEFIPLGQARQPSGKLVAAWALEGDCDPAAIKSNTFSMEWPRGSGTVREYPEVDRAGWFALAEARRKILPGQVAFLDRLSQHLGRG
jgi:predicted NUDIX family NTP pyrophosphohydrolase